LFNEKNVLFSKFGAVFIVLFLSTFLFQHFQHYLNGYFISFLILIVDNYCFLNSYQHSYPLTVDK